VLEEKRSNSVCLCAFPTPVLSLPLFLVKHTDLLSLFNVTRVKFSGFHFQGFNKFKQSRLAQNAQLGSKYLQKEVTSRCFLC